mmetsp:Transcript_37866/g.49849  ORF Transcript_37866/g.49849 Transcript_37866/m.49849 type:complete len:913 (-) Transcript_37866:343-3081(-)
MLTHKKASRIIVEHALNELNLKNVSQGLSSAEVLQRQQLYEPNELIAQEDDPLYIKFLEQFKDPLIMLLLGSAIISFLFGQFDDAISITLAVAIVGTVAFIQEYRSEQTLQALSKLVPPHCKVLRDEQVHDVMARELVPGDVVVLEAGDRVPADCRVVEETELMADESSLTGEGVPAQKTQEALNTPVFALQEEVELAEFTNLVFMGTLICNGHGKAVVIATGMQTEFGKTFEEMREVNTRRTPLQLKMDDLGKQLSLISIAIIVVIAMLGVFQGKNLLDMFQIGVSLAVAAIPEGLPICVTVTLALGVMRMANRKAIVKKLPAVEALGCATVVCCDKTGTLTKNQMTVEQIHMMGVELNIQVSGVGYQTQGDFTLNGEKISPQDNLALEKLLQTGCLCNNATLHPDGKVTGQPTELALLVANAKAGLEDARSSRPRVHEVAFSSQRKRMEVRVQEPEGLVYHVKGTIEGVLESCSTYMSFRGDILPLSEYEREITLKTAAEMGRKGLRVLAGAYGMQFNALTFAGLFGMRDPPRVGAQEAVTSMQSSQVQLVMITGDAKETAVAIAESMGFYDPSFHRAMSGAEIERLQGQKFQDHLERIAVFYRVSPRHKLSIVRAYQENEEVVAMTGDGVNDAAALKAADIGVAMGESGTDVAKEAADMIILDDNFATIVNAIEEGKSIFYNIKNFLTFQLSTSVAALTLIAMSTVLGLPSPLNAMQILWINIIMDGPPAQSLGVEPVDHAVMSRPPRRSSDQIIGTKLLVRVVTSGILIVIGTLWVFYKEMEDGQVTRRDTTMTFTTFVTFDMMNALCCRSSEKFVFQLDLFGNKAFLFAVGGSLLGQMLVIYFPPLQAVFQTEALSVGDLLYICAIASSLLVLDSVRKIVCKLGSRPQSTGIKDNFKRKLPTMHEIV